MDKLVERIDFGVGEDLDSLVDWAVFAGAREDQPAAPSDYACGRAVASSNEA